MKIILFDFDGVIVDTFSFCHRISNMKSPVTEEEYRARFEGNINDAIKQREPRPTTTPFNFFEKYTPELLLCQPNPELTQVIQTLAREYTLIIISSTISQSIAEFLDLHHLRGYFKEILGNDVEKSKIKKIQDILQRHNIPPSETVFVTDTLGDIREAEACDVRSIAVSWGFHSIETLEKGNPYKIITRPDQLLEAIRSVE